jgi:hypothetical protein
VSCGEAFCNRRGIIQHCDRATFVRFHRAVFSLLASTYAGLDAKNDYSGNLGGNFLQAARIQVNWAWNVPEAAEPQVEDRELDFS